MPNLRDKKLAGVFRGLFVGVTGVGKTVAAASFPGPIKIYDFDDRVDPVKLFYPDRDDIDYIAVISGDPGQRRDAVNFWDFVDEFWELQNRCPWETVIIDSFTSLSNCVIQYSMGQDPDNKKKLRAREIDLPFMDEYKAETQVASKLMEQIKALPCHVIITAHPIMKLRLEVPGKLESMVSYQSIVAHGTKTPSIVPNYFNEQYYFYTDKTSQLGQKPIRRVCTVQTGDILAKTALPLPPVFDITDKPLYNVIQAFLKDHNLKLEAKRQKVAEKGEIAAVS